MKAKSIMFALSIEILFMSFTTRQPAEKLSAMKGTYGVYDCDSKASASWKFELSFNDDYTFHYINSSNLAKPIDVTGKWERKGNVIILKDYDSKFSIHKKWKVADDQKSIRSRKGMEFTRLCVIEPCH